MGIGSSKPKQTENPLNQNQINRKKDQLGKISQQILKIEKIEDNIEDLLILYERYKTLRIENVELEEHFTQLMTNFVKSLIQNKTDPKDIKYWQQRYKKAVHKQTIGRDIDPKIQAMFNNTVKQTNKAIQQQKQTVIKNTLDSFKALCTDMTNQGPQELIDIFKNFMLEYPGGNAEVDKHFGASFEKYLSTYYGPGKDNKSLYSYGESENPITIIQSLYDSYLAITQSYRDSIPAIDDKVKAAYTKALSWANEINSQKVPKNLQAVNIKQNQQTLSKDITIFTPKQQSVTQIISQLAQQTSAEDLVQQLLSVADLIDSYVKKDKKLEKILTEIDDILELVNKQGTQQVTKQQLLLAKQRLAKISQQLSKQQQILITPVQQQVAATVQDAVEQVVAQQVPGAPQTVVEQVASDAAQAVVQSAAVQKAVQQGQKQANAQGSTQSATQAAAGQVLKQQQVKQQVAQAGAQAVQDAAKQTVAGQVAGQVEDVVADAVTQQVPDAAPQVVDQAAKDAAQSVVESPVVQKAVQKGQKQANSQGSTQAATQAAAQQVLNQAAVQQAIMKAAKQAIAKAQQQNKTQQQITSAIEEAAAEAIRTSAPKASVQKIKQLVEKSVKKVQDQRVQQKKKVNQA